MSSQPKLSALAEELLRLHQADYRPGVGGKPDYKRVKGHADDEIVSAYRELVQAGLLEQSDMVSYQGDAPRYYYALSPKGKQGLA